jgi:hypothetical protein
MTSRLLMASERKKLWSSSKMSDDVETQEKNGVPFIEGDIRLMKSGRTWLEKMIAVR